MANLIERIEATIRDVPDFPKKGILFKDITPVLQDGALFNDITEHFRARYADQNIDAVLGIESRGFIFGAPLANALGVGLVLVRKPGKLPADKVGIDYELEYGTDRLEMHADAVKPGQRVVVIDDLLATGGTASATVSLAKELGAEVVECAFLIELGFLAGRERVDSTCYSVISVDD